MISVFMCILSIMMALFAIYARMTSTLNLALTLFVFCWVGSENVHKAFRLIPIVLCFIITIMSIYQSGIYGMNYYYYDFIAILSALTAVFLLVSMIPDARNHRRVKS